MNDDGYPVDDHGREEWEPTLDRLWEQFLCGWEGPTPRQWVEHSARQDETVDALAKEYLLLRNRDHIGLRWCGRLGPNSAPSWRRAVTVVCAIADRLEEIGDTSMPWLREYLTHLLPERK